jgi:hypothetical protein
MGPGSALAFRGALRRDVRLSGTTSVLFSDSTVKQLDARDSAFSRREFASELLREPPS